MKIIGVVGGIGSGKSTVARYLRDLGSGLIEVDKITHEALQLPEVIDQTRARFEKYGYSPTENHKANRKSIAKIVIANEEEFKWLERLTLPIVEEMLKKRMSRYIDGIPALTLDCPLLFETGWDKLCDLVLFVDTSPEVRCLRYVKRCLDIPQDADPSTYASPQVIAELTQKWASLEGRQMPLSKKKEKANFVINANERYQLATEDFWRIYIGEPVTPAWARSD